MKTVKNSEVNGEVNAPGSKSMMIRAVAASFLAKETSEILNPSFADDCLASIEIIQALGAEVTRENKRLLIKRGKEIEKQTHINCGESGLCIRMFSPIAALFKKQIILGGCGSLLKRPVGMIETPLSQLGVYCGSDNGFPPLAINGPMQGGEISIDGSKTSQFLTGLLMSLPVCEGDSRIEVKNLKSKPYVKMTISLLEKYGIEIEHDEELTIFKINGNQKYRSCEYIVEGDWSGASFLLVAGAIGGKIKVTNLDLNSRQADIRILEVLEKVGAKIEKENNHVKIEKNRLEAFEFDATDCPDLFPPLVALAVNCNGKSKIRGVERLRVKESDRAQTLKQEFKKLGIEIDIIENEMCIIGGEIKGENVKSHNDHRIAMACAIAGINSKNPVKIENSECVSKSYPEFFNDLGKLGVDVE